MTAFFEGLSEIEAAALFAILPLIGGAIGFVVSRWWTKASSHEHAAYLNTLADLRSKMEAGGMSISDIRDFESRIKRGDEAGLVAMLSDVSVEEGASEGNLPQQYWTTYAMSARASAKLALLDAQLDEVQTDLGTLISEQENEFLEKAHRAWKAYRSRSMSYAGSEYLGGTVAPLIGIAHGITLTEQRIATMTADLTDRKARMG